jgi:prolyl-tRNA synthetase
MTHEEAVTYHVAREIRSYRELPKLLYHFQVKERDEPRPRAGLLRTREFIMKDSYSFDRDEDGLERSFRAHEQAYLRIFERCGLEVHAAVAESGMMGGSASLDFLAPAGAGENLLVTCERADYIADSEIARGIPRAPEFPERLDAPVEVETPGVTTIEAVAELLGVDAAATAKAMPVVKLDGTLVLGLIRGDDRLEEAKVVSALASDFRPATEEEIREAFGADPGSIGPIGFMGEIVVDEALRDGQFVAGANVNGRHLRGVQTGRDYVPRFADLRQAKEGDSCPICGGKLTFQPAIEVGHIFKLDTRFSEPLGATFLDADGKERPLVMGSYGIGPGRIVAAVVEQRSDGDAIVWPRAIAPYEAEVVSLDAGDTEILYRAEEAAVALEAAGLSVLLDDRDQRAGEKFADGDLFGAPVRVIVGKKTLSDGFVDAQDRATGEEGRLASLELEKWVVAR